MQITKISNEIVDITIALTDIKRIIRKYIKLYAKKLHSLDKMHKFLKDTSYQNCHPNKL